MTPADDQPFPSTGEFSSPEAEARFRAAVHEGLDDVAAGRVISGEAVLAWMKSWFTENELPPPECGD